MTPKKRKEKLTIYTTNKEQTTQIKSCEVTQRTKSNIKLNEHETKELKLHRSTQIYKGKKEKNINRYRNSAISVQEINTKP